MNSKTLNRTLPADIGIAGTNAMGGGGARFALLVAISIAACAMVQFFYLATGISGALSGRLPDTDDYIRLMQALRWLDGGGWHDMMIARLNPPEGVWMHWSRLPDLPLAAIVALLQPWFGREMAAMAATIIVPAALLVAFLITCGWMARPVLGRADVPLVPLLALFPATLIIQFAPGRIDHHSWQLILAALAVGALMRVALRPESLAPPVAAALACAAGMWIGGDIIPWIALFSAVLAGFWIAYGERWLAPARTFGAVLFGVSLLLLPAALPPARWFEISCDSYSIVNIGLAGTVALFWLALGVKALPSRTPLARAAAAAICGLAGLGLLVALFPECRNGPYGNLDARLHAVWLSGIAEARSLTTLFAKRQELLPVFISLPLTALAVSIARAVKRQGRARRLWLVVAAALVMGLAMSAWQIRVLAFAYLFALTPATWAILAAARRGHGWRRGAIIFAGLLAAGPLMSLTLPLAADLYHSGAFAKVASGEKHQSCDFKELAKHLSDPAGLGSRPRLVAAYVDNGPELLYRTPHSVLGAPYHRNRAGILDTYDIFMAPDPLAAQAVLRRRGVELVFMCPAPRDLRNYERPGQRTFATRLAAGETPSWLKPIALPDEVGYLLFEVR